MCECEPREEKTSGCSHSRNGTITHSTLRERYTDILRLLCIWEITDTSSIPLSAPLALEVLTWQLYFPGTEVQRNAELTDCLFQHKRRYSTRGWRGGPLWVSMWQQFPQLRSSVLLCLCVSCLSPAGMEPREAPEDTFPGVKGLYKTHSSFHWEQTHPVHESGIAWEVTAWSTGAGPDRLHAAFCAAFESFFLFF